LPALTWLWEIFLCEAFHSTVIISSSNCYMTNIEENMVKRERSRIIFMRCHIRAGNLSLHQIFFFLHQDYETSPTNEVGKFYPLLVKYNNIEWNIYQHWSLIKNHHDIKMINAIFIGIFFSLLYDWQILWNILNIQVSNSGRWSATECTKSQFFQTRRETDQRHERCFMWQKDRRFHFQQLLVRYITA
jgi:hypothetical protein